MPGSFDQHGRLEILDGRILGFFGKKRSGKSALALAYFLDFPGDALVVDVAGDDGPSGPELVTEIHGDVETLPRRWPEHLRREDRRMVLRYVPDPGSPTRAEDIDAALALAISHGDRQKNAGKGGVCVLIHEIGRVAPAGATMPHMSRILDHNRHHGVTLLECGPRSKTINPLCVSQADLLFLFEMPNPLDRVRIAENIGWDPTDLAAAMNDLPPHGYLMFDANLEKPAEGEPDLRLVEMPPLPEDIVKHVKAA